MVKQLIRKMLSNSSYFRSNILNDAEHEQYWKWLYSGKPVPPPDLVKRMTVKEYANRYNIKIMVETGTYRGDMVFAVRNIFDEIYSIELDDNLYTNAVERFRKYENITIIKGDSSEMIPKITEGFKESCLFWLDGHYMPSIGTKGEKETPILKEIGYISNHASKNHVLLIDDARFFTGKYDYPTMEEFRNIVNVRFPNYSILVKNDIIRITPNDPY